VAEERGIALAISTEPELYLHGSRELASQALANLVDNALKYGCPEAQGLGPDRAQGEAPKGTIELTARRHGDSVEFVVADRGPGIAANDRLRVLDRFVRLENAHARPGSGLGLSLAAAVARLHNGTLRIEDNEPGLRVVICLPGALARREPTAPLALPRPDKAA
jgi:signal transduction histidine kinase